MRQRGRRIYPSNLTIHTTRSLDYEQSFFGEVRRVTLKKSKYEKKSTKCTYCLSLPEFRAVALTSRVFLYFFLFRCFCFVLFVLLFVCFFGEGGCATVFAEKERPFVVYALPLSKRTTRWMKSCHLCCVTKTRQRVQRIKFHWQTKVVSFPPDMVEDKIEI